MNNIYFIFNQYLLEPSNNCIDQSSEFFLLKNEFIFKTSRNYHENLF